MLQREDRGFQGILTHTDVREFQALMRAECQVEMSEAEAWNRAIELLALVRMMVRQPVDPSSNTLQAGRSSPISLDRVG